ncbi:pilus assembly FimT family protein [Thalassotalea agarivorans]|uniref:MSHA pilin protein MshA n=1 Tax=Thalassotalea agarivorans TaxID=349064 RepID=A0A1I0B673_THASX|nr:type II secretion system protein [Thalassotalea agarivorans]SET01526.1 MSHA pilin protein MshA [Thalassotalea agarivorans]
MKAVNTKVQGFTLIELVIVIVLLGILSVVAAPKFVDINKDAKIAVLNGAKGAIESGLDLFAAKALNRNNVKPVPDGDLGPIRTEGYVEINGVDIGIINDIEPAFDVFRLEEQVNALFDMPETFDLAPGVTDLGFYLYYNDKPESLNCYVRYAQGADDQVMIETSSC